MKYGLRRHVSRRISPIEQNTNRKLKWKEKHLKETEKEAEEAKEKEKKEVEKRDLKVLTTSLLLLK